MATQATDCDPGSIIRADGILWINEQEHRGKPTNLANFTNFDVEVESRSVNKEPGHSKCYLFKCSVKDTGETFKVPVYLSETDSNKDLISKFDRAKSEAGGVLNHQKIKKTTQFNKFIYEAMRNYDLSSNPRSPSIMFTSTGFQTVDLDGVNMEVYIVGPHSVIWLNQKPKQEVKLFYVKRSNRDEDLPDKQVMTPDDIPKDLLEASSVKVLQNEYLAELLIYHGINAPVLLLTISYFYLSHFRKDLYQHGLFFGVLNLTGPVSTGKTELHRHIMTTMPREGEDFEVVLECSKSKAPMKRALTGFRYPICEDPPSLEKDDMNQMIDFVYQVMLDNIF